ncbi:MAG: hypothetical protein IT302_08715 [Dehalococcoidia bacterium]|nr:hypothetical protein [Dehalococcoidia bacterium]
MGWRIRVAMVASSLLFGTACGSGGDEPTPPATAPSLTATATLTLPTATPTPPVEEEVINAYLRFWDLYAEAVLKLDPSVMEGAVSAEEFERVKNDVADLEAQGLAARVVIEHNPVVIEVTETSAVLLDEMTNNSFYVDPETLDPPEAEGSGATFTETFFLERVDGQWIVIRSVRQQ